MPRPVFLLTLLLFLLPALPSLAQDKTESFDLGGDRFIAGRIAAMSEPGGADVFLAGERVTLEAEITGSAHMAGRWVTVSGPVGQGLYAAGQEVRVGAAVTGNATLAGQRVDVTAPIGGNLRVFGSEITLSAAIEGTLLAGGEFVEIDGPVTGDIALSARELRFGPDAAISGTLTLYEDDPGEIMVPESVIPADRVQREEISEWEPIREGGFWPGVKAVISFALGVLLVALVAAAAAALMPQTFAAMRAQLLGHPFRTLLTGFIAQSTVIGAGILLAMTLIGLLLTPAALFFAILAGLAGYIVGAYALGVAALKLAGQGFPQEAKHRAFAALAGAVIAALVALIPLIGWIAIMALSLAGLGAVTRTAFPHRFQTAG